MRCCIRSLPSGRADHLQTPPLRTQAFHLCGQHPQGHRGMMRMEFAHEAGRPSGGNDAVHFVVPEQGVPFAHMHLVKQPLDVLQHEAQLAFRFMRGHMQKVFNGRRFSCMRLQMRVLQGLWHRPLGRTEQHRSIAELREKTGKGQGLIRHAVARQGLTGTAVEDVLLEARTRRLRVSA